MGSVGGSLGGNVVPIVLQAAWMAHGPGRVGRVMDPSPQLPARAAGSGRRGFPDWAGVMQGHAWLGGGWSCGLGMGLAWAAAVGRRAAGCVWVGSWCRGRAAAAATGGGREGGPGLGLTGTQRARQVSLQCACCCGWRVGVALLRDSTMRAGHGAPPALRATLPLVCVAAGSWHRSTGRGRRLAAAVWTKR